MEQVRSHHNVHAKIINFISFIDQIEAKSSTATEKDKTTSMTVRGNSVECSINTYVSYDMFSCDIQLAPVDNVQSLRCQQLKASKKTNQKRNRHARRMC